MTSESATCVINIWKIYLKFEIICECTMNVLLYMITILVVMH